MQVAGHVVGLTHVGQHELPHVLVALAAAAAALAVRFLATAVLVRRAYPGTGVATALWSVPYELLVVPVLFARDQVDEEIIATAMQLGARDVVTLMNPNRLRLVVTRELEAHRQARTLNSTISSAR